MMAHFLTTQCTTEMRHDWSIYYFQHYKFLQWIIQYISNVLTMLVHFWREGVNGPYKWRLRLNQIGPLKFQGPVLREKSILIA